MNSIRRAIALLTLLSLFGCTTEPTPSQIINANRKVYEEWLSQAAPYLADVPEGALAECEFTKYRSKEKLYPRFDYTILAPNGYGVFSLGYQLDLDSQYRVLGIQSQWISYFNLRTRKVGKMKDGRTFAGYYGIYLKDDAIAETINRIVAGELFSDLDERVFRAGKMLRSVTIERDSWAELAQNREIPTR